MTSCLITGANRGIGLELARLYARRGAPVVAAARKPAAANDLWKLADAHANVHIAAANVIKPATLTALVDALQGRSLDLLIVNAGVSGPRGPMADPANTTAAWADVLATNVSGVFFTISALAPHITRGTGKIAIISSRMGSSKAATGSSYLYRASKAAAANLGANFAAELKPSGIAVGSYHPGWVKTDMGGSGAEITVAVSAAGLAERFDHLSLATTGLFEDYTGAPIAY